MEEILKLFDLVPRDVPMIAVSTILFIILLKFLDKRLFSPYLALIEAREEMTSGAEVHASEIKALAQAKSAEYNTQILNARIEAMKRKLEVLDNAKPEASKIMERAEGEGQEILRNARWEIKEKITSLKADAFKDADSMVDTIVRKLSEPASPPPANSGTSIN